MIVNLVESTCRLGGKSRHTIITKPVALIENVGEGVESSHRKFRLLDQADSGFMQFNAKRLEISPLHTETVFLRLQQGEENMIVDPIAFPIN
jgi:hypothetical protein